MGFPEGPEEVAAAVAAIDRRIAEIDWVTSVLLTARRLVTREETNAPRGFEELFFDAVARGLTIRLRVQLSLKTESRLSYSAGAISELIGDMDAVRAAWDRKRVDLEKLVAGAPRFRFGPAHVTSAAAYRQAWQIVDRAFSHLPGDATIAAVDISPATININIGDAEDPRYLDMAAVIATALKLEQHESNPLGDGTAVHHCWTGTCEGYSVRIVTTAPTGGDQSE